MSIHDSVVPARTATFRSSNFITCFVIFILLGAMRFARADVTVTTMFSFSNTNGSTPNALIMGTDGNFYGTTLNGGANGAGTVFKFSTNNIFTTLYSFNGTNGSAPVGLAQGMDGNFYGTTSQGGANHLGTVFKLTPGGSLTTLVSFNGTNGGNPYAAMVQDTNSGYFYGTTLIGGASAGNGTVFKLTTNGTLTTLASFNGTNGANPYGKLTLASGGKLYGTTYFGGTNNDHGTVFRIDTNGVLTSLRSFDNVSLGANPYGGVIQGKDGNFYGTTTQGGTNGYGTLFAMDTNGNVTILTSFDSVSGASPYSQLVQVASSNIYGPTLFGGTNNNNGTLFRLSSNHTFTSLYSFGDTNQTGAANPYSSLVQAADGSLYGTTYAGGANGSYGTIYRFTMKSPIAPTLAILPKGTNVGFRWNSQAGTTYQLQFTSLAQGLNWTNVGSQITATNNSTTSVDVVASSQQRYFRLVAIQPPL